MCFIRNYSSEQSFNGTFVNLGIAESPPKVEGVISTVSSASPDIIEATPRSKSTSLRLSLDLQSEENTSKRTLFLDTSNLSTKCENIRNEEETSTPRKRSHDDDVLGELLDELENSPPKRKSPAKTSPQPSAVLDSSVSSRKKLKLSPSRINDCDTEKKCPIVCGKNASDGETIAKTAKIDRNVDKITENGRSKCDSFVDVEDLGDFFENVDSYGNK